MRTVLPSERLTALLSALGLRLVAVAFSETERAALAQLCARIGEPAASQLVAEVQPGYRGLGGMADTWLAESDGRE